MEPCPGVNFRKVGMNRHLQVCDVDYVMLYNETRPFYNPVLDTSRLNAEVVAFDFIEPQVEIIHREVNPLVALPAARIFSSTPLLSELTMPPLEDNFFPALQVFPGSSLSLGQRHSSDSEFQQLNLLLTEEVSGSLLNGTNSGTSASAHSDPWQRYSNDIYGGAGEVPGYGTQAWGMFGDVEWEKVSAVANGTPLVSPRGSMGCVALGL